MRKSRILVWDLPTRAFHWLLALCFAGAFATGGSVGCEPMNDAPPVTDRKDPILIGGAADAAWAAKATPAMAAKRAKAVKPVLKVMTLLLEKWNWRSGPLHAARARGMVFRYSKAYLNASAPA